MDLKLRDEITKILIEEPGISIGQIAKKTGNYYSYTHKVVSEMEELGLIVIEKNKQGKKEITTCNIKEDYKKRWVEDLKKIVKPLMKDAEVKIAFLMMYLFIAYSFVQKIIPAGELQTFKASALVGTEDALESLRATTPDPLINITIFGVELILLILIPALLIVWSYRKKK